MDSGNKLLSRNAASNYFQRDSIVSYKKTGWNAHYRICTAAVKGNAWQQIYEVTLQGKEIFGAEYLHSIFYLHLVTSWIYQGRKKNKATKYAGKHPIQLISISPSPWNCLSQSFFLRQTYPTTNSSLIWKTSCLCTMTSYVGNTECFTALWKSKDQILLQHQTEFLSYKQQPA